MQIYQTQGQLCQELKSVQNVEFARKPNPWGPPVKINEELVGSIYLHWLYCGIIFELAGAPNEDIVQNHLT